ncbi:MAG TPA: Zn-dependent membrane protease [Frankiaceae bacterium]|nr:Zn-dependent membrane protease [Frankiaceae bacterium]
MLFHLADPAALLGIALALVLGILAHDAAQVLAAQALGDPLPRRSGRLTLRPAAHAGPFSAVAMVIVGNGWAEPVRMNDRWRRRRFHVAAAVLAGPLAYLLLCLAALAGLRGVVRAAATRYGERSVDVIDSLPFGGEVLLWMAVTFGSLLILSLVPVPPLDGGRLLFTLGPTSPGWAQARHNLEERNWGLAVVLALLLLPVLFAGFPSVTGQLVGPLLRGLSPIVGLGLG